MTGAPTLLKLVALDREGLGVISAHAQDSCLRRSEMVYLPKQKRFLVSAMRFDWAAAKEGVSERVGSVLRFDRVLRVSHLGLAGRDDNATLNLLAVTFETTDPPSGMVLLAFADGAIVRLEVECLEAELRDIGPRRPAHECPGHALTSAESD
ncbi:MAG: DUF2948 family protein [Hyphomicrobiales bacterium]|nr:DUF2948 family protein [Hyphomicrobiales bacterium]